MRCFPGSRSGHRQELQVRTRCGQRGGARQGTCSGRTRSHTPARPYQRMGLLRLRTRHVVERDGDCNVRPASRVGKWLATTGSDIVWPIWTTSGELEPLRASNTSVLTSARRLFKCTHKSSSLVRLADNHGDRKILLRMQERPEECKNVWRAWRSASSKRCRTTRDMMQLVAS